MLNVSNPRRINTCQNRGGGGPVADRRRAVAGLLHVLSGEKGVGRLSEVSEEEAMESGNQKSKPHAQPVPAARGTWYSDARRSRTRLNRRKLSSGIRLVAGK
jgi:hypothetical protein